jgi:hypothetical protein
VADDEIELVADVVASAPVERLDLFYGLEHLETFRPYSPADLGATVSFTKAPNVAAGRVQPPGTAHFRSWATKPHGRA